MARQNVFVITVTRELAMTSKDVKMNGCAKMWGICGEIDLLNVVLWRYEY